MGEAIGWILVAVSIFACGWTWRSTKDTTSRIWEN